MGFLIWGQHWQVHVGLKFLLLCQHVCLFDIFLLLSYLDWAGGEHVDTGVEPLSLAF